MFRLLRDDPLELVACFPFLGPRSEHSSHPSHSHISSHHRPHLGTTPLRSASHAVALGEDDEDLLILPTCRSPQPAGLACAGANTWAHGSMADVSHPLSLLSVRGGDPLPNQSPRRFFWSPLAPDVVAAFSDEAIGPHRSLLCVQDPSTATAVLFGVDLSDPSRYGYQALGRLCLRRELRPAAAHTTLTDGDGFPPKPSCALAFSFAQARRPTVVSSPQSTRQHQRAPIAESSSLSFEERRETTEEYVVSSAVHRVRFVSCRSANQTAGRLPAGSHLVVLFRCGRLGVFDIAVNIGAAETAAAVDEVVPRGLTDPLGGIPLLLTHVQHTSLCVAVLMCTSRKCPQCVVYCAHSGGVVLTHFFDQGEWLTGPPTSLTVVAPSNVSYNPPDRPHHLQLSSSRSPAALESGTKFDVLIGSAVASTIHRLSVELQRGPGQQESCRHVATFDDQPEWLVVRVGHLTDLSLRVEPSYFADSNVHTPAAESTRPAHDSDDCEGRDRVLPQDDEPYANDRGALCGSFGDDARELLSSLLQQPILSVDATTTRLAGGHGPRYGARGVVVATWPQAVALIDANFDDGRNAVLIIQCMCESVSFERAWCDERCSDDSKLVLYIVTSNGALETHHVLLAEATADREWVSLPVVGVRYVSSQVSRCRAAPQGVVFCASASQGTVVLYVPSCEDFGMDYKLRAATLSGGQIKLFAQGGDAAPRGDAIRAVRVIDSPHPVVVILFVNGCVRFGPLGGDAASFASLKPPCGPGEPSVTSMMVLMRPEDGTLRLVTGHAAGVLAVWEHNSCVVRSSFHAGAIDSVLDSNELVSSNERAKVSGRGLIRFFENQCACLSASTASGTIVLHHRRTFVALRRFATPLSSPLSRLAVHPGFEGLLACGENGLTNVWRIREGTLERLLSGEEIGRIDREALIDVPLGMPAPPGVSLCEYVTLRFVGRQEVALQTAMTPLIGRLHAEVIAAVHASDASVYQLRSPTQRSEGMMLAFGSTTFSPRVALALATCLRVIDDTSITASAEHADPPQVVPCFAQLAAMLSLPASPQPATASFRRSMLRDGAHGARLAIMLMALLRVIEPLIALREMSVLHACRAVLVGEQQSQPSGDGAVGGAEPCIATCVPYVLHPLMVVQHAAREVMDGVVRTVPIDTLLTLLRSMPPLSTDLRSHQSDQRCLGKALLAARLASRLREISASTSTPTSLPTHAMLEHVAYEVQEYLLRWCDDGMPPAAPAPLSAQPVVLSVLAEAWPELQCLFSKRDELFTKLFAKCVVDAQIEYRYNLGARAIVDIAALSIADFVGVAERWYEKVAWRAGLLQLFARIVQQHPSVVLYAFPTVILHFAWKTLDPHTPHRSERDAWCGAVVGLFRVAVRALPTVGFHQTLQRLVVGQGDGQVALYDVKSTALVCVFQSHTDPIACVAYSASSTTEIAVLSAALDTVRFWRVEKSAAAGLLGLFAHGSLATARVIGSVDVPVVGSMREDLRMYSRRLVPPDVIVSKCRLAWLSPSCVELTTPWHDRVQLILQYK